MEIADVMLDLETLGKKPGCPVISIGACTFDMSTNKRGATFHQKLSLQDQFDLGLLPDADTISWWMTQSDAAREIFKRESKPTIEVLKLFTKWFKAQGSSVYVWGNGSSFDMSILEAVYDKFGLDNPWRYNKIMDLRTYKRLVAGGAQIPRLKGTHHDALDDAVNQMEYVMKHNKLRKKK